ncbi:type IV secretion system protein TraC [Succinimonas amylolytica]|uniref:type IV secretion system protein TraC n=1 Tax=Succinimonas amylolytica TaxID=83769 RepID=UPI000369D220|nr:type IV secretion system protein TraC [Succinimonas amylolytica]
MSGDYTARLSTVYPVLAYDAENALFLISGSRTSDLGFGFVSSPLCGSDESISDRLEVFLNSDFPENTRVQFSLVASPAVQELLAENAATAVSLPPECFLRRIIENKNEFLKRGTRTPLPRMASPVRNYLLIVTVSIPVSGICPDAAAIAEVSRLRVSLEEVLKTAGIRANPLSAGAFLETLTPFFNMSPESSWTAGGPPAVNPELLLCDQLLDFDSGIKVFQDHLEAGGYYVNTFSVKRYPDFVFFGQARRYQADLLTGTRGIRVPFIMTGTILAGSARKLRSGLNARRQWAVNQACGPLMKFMPRLAVKKRGLDLICGEMDNGSRPLRLCLSLITFARDEAEAVSVRSQVRTYYRENGFELIPDRYVCLPVFLNALPFGADYEAARGLMRYRTFTAREILPLLPLFGDSPGTGQSVLNLISRSGQLMNLSLYDSATNYNLCIAAQSGSGKSFLVNELLVSFLARGAVCYVIDVGRSYEKLAEFLEGTFLSFGLGSGVSLNPFCCVRSYDEEADMLNGLLAAMLAPTEKLTDFQGAALKRILRELFRKHGTALSLDLLADELNASPDQRIRDLGTQLFPFTSGGEYGRFFAGSNSLAFSGSLTVLELEELKGRKHLQQVVLLQLIYQIQQDMYLGERDRPKILIIDEAWDLLRDGDTSSFIETGYRRFRKYGGAAVTVTQSVNDLYESPAGMAIMENSAHMYLMGQKAETVDGLREHSRLPLTPGGYDLLKSVHTEPGAYSEIFVISGGGAAIGRLVVDPFRQLLYSTRAQDVTAINAYRKAGMSLTAAVNAVLRDREEAASGRESRAPENQPGNSGTAPGAPA